MAVDLLTINSCLPIENAGYDIYQKKITVIGVTDDEIYR